MIRMNFILWKWSFFLYLIFAFNLGIHQLAAIETYRLYMKVYYNTIDSVQCLVQQFEHKLNNYSELMQQQNIARTPHIHTCAYNDADPWESNRELVINSDVCVYEFMYNFTAERNSKRSSECSKNRKDIWKKLSATHKLCDEENLPIFTVFV